MRPDRFKLTHYHIPTTETHLTRLDET